MLSTGSPVPASSALPTQSSPTRTANADSSTPRGKRPRRSRRVLVVEDSPDMLTSWLLLLELWGHEACSVADGYEAVEMARSFRPDIVLLDIGLPGLDGWEVARRIRQQAGQPPLMIAVTGYGRDADRRRSREVGIDHHLVKPVDPETLEALLAPAEERPALLDSWDGAAA